MEAFVEIGAARRFADGVQAEAAEVALKIVDRCKMVAAFSQPNR
jgi:hypothetical protein